MLADSEPVHLAAEQAAVAAHGHKLTKATKQPFVGLANAEIMHGLIELFEIDATITEPLDPEFGRAHLLVPAGMQSADAEAIRAFHRRGLSLEDAASAPP